MVQTLSLTLRHQIVSVIFRCRNFLTKNCEDYINSLYGIEDDTRIFPVTKSYLHHEMRRGCEIAGERR